MYRIRPAQRQDYPALTAIWEEAVSSTHNFLDEEYYCYIRNRLPGYFESCRMFVSEADGVVVGFIGVSEDKIEMLFVGIRGMGVGKGLLYYATKHLGVRRVDVNVQNHSAVGFYRKYGFRESGRSEIDSECRLYPLLHMEL